MPYRLFVLGLLCWGIFASAPSFACRYIQSPVEEKLAEAPVAFVGAVAVNEMGLVTFHGEKSIRGTEDGAEFTVEEESSSCGIGFAPGSIWLYLGASQPSGTLMLMNEYGHIEEAGAKIALEKTGYDVTKSPSVQSGEISATCTPWDGAAFAVTLENGIAATAYESMPEDFGPGVKSYILNEEGGGMGGGNITICPTNPMQKRPCTLHRGKITFSSMDSETARGQIEIEDGEHKTTHVFSVKRSAKTAFCG